MTFGGRDDEAPLGEARETDAEIDSRESRNTSSPLTFVLWIQVVLHPIAIRGDRVPDAAVMTHKRFLEWPRRTNRTDAHELTSTPVARARGREHRRRRRARWAYIRSKRRCPAVSADRARDIIVYVPLI